MMGASWDGTATPCCRHSCCGLTWKEWRPDHKQPDISRKGEHALVHKQRALFAHHMITLLYTSGCISSVFLSIVITYPSENWMYAHFLSILINFDLLGYFHSFWCPCKFCSGGFVARVSNKSVSQLSVERFFELIDLQKRRPLTDWLIELISYWSAKI